MESNMGRRSFIDSGFGGRVSGQLIGIIKNSKKVITILELNPKKS